MVKLKEKNLLPLFFCLFLSFIRPNSAEKVTKNTNETIIKDNLASNKFNLTSNDKNFNNSKFVNHTDYLSDDNLENNLITANDLVNSTTVRIEITSSNTSTFSASNSSPSNSGSLLTNTSIIKENVTLSIPESISNQNNLTTDLPSAIESQKNLMAKLSEQIEFDYGSEYFPEENFLTDYKFPEQSSYKTAVARAAKKDPKNKSCRSLCREYVGSVDGQCVKANTRTVSPYCESDHICKCDDRKIRE